MFLCILSISLSTFFSHFQPISYGKPSHLLLLSVRDVYDYIGAVKDTVYSAQGLVMHNTTLHKEIKSVDVSALHDGHTSCHLTRNGRYNGNVQHN